MELPAPVASKLTVVPTWTDDSVLVQSLVAVFKLARYPLFSCLSMLWAIDTAAEQAATILGDLQCRLCQSDETETGALAYSSLCESLHAWDNAAADCTKAQIKRAFELASGECFRMPKRIRWKGEDDNPVYEF